MKTLAIIQPFYIPWKGYFDIINDCDEYIIYDDVRYTEHSWINRNQIKSSMGAQWLTIPVKTKGRYDQTISEAQLIDTKWAKKHFLTIQGFYSKAPYWKQYRDCLEEMYCMVEQKTNIGLINEVLIRKICKMLGITTVIKKSKDYPLSTTEKNDKLIELCKQAGATRYISGPAAKDYIKSEQFEESGIELIWKDYSGYPEYPQLHGEFMHSVSILDLILNVGDEAPYYIWGWRNKFAK